MTFVPARDLSVLRPLPHVAAAAEEGEAYGERSGGAGQDHSLLIVDAEDEFADRLAALAETLGYACERAADLESAAVQLPRRSPTILMLDQKLVPPGSSAWSELRAQAANAVIVTTGRDLAAPLVLRALRNGAYDHFDKAMGSGELAVILARCLGEERRRRLTQATYEQLRLAKEAAESANRAKSEFLATMGHELRTPLNAVIGFSEIMLNEVLGPVGNEQYKGYLRDIHAGGCHLLEVINNILDLSKAEAGRLELVERRVEIAPMIETVLRMVRPRAADAGLVLKASVPPGVPALRGDEPKLKKIMLNLLSNAVKFTPSGGRIEIEAAPTPRGGLSIAVRDSGIGIDEANLATMLEPFRQADGSLSRSYGGVGLGLPLAQAFAELHHGTMTIASRPGEGTSVTLEFPPDRVEPTRG
jgi:signal transduction histidine kinase